MWNYHFPLIMSKNNNSHFATHFKALMTRIGLVWSDNRDEKFFRFTSKLQFVPVCF